MEKGRVDTGFDHFISIANKERKEKLEMYKDMLPTVLGAEEHSVVTDIAGVKIHRLKTFRLSKLSCYPGGNRIFYDCCKILSSRFFSILDDMNIYIRPDMIFALGGADRIGNQLVNIFDKTQDLEIVCYTLRKVLEGKTLKEISFEEHDEHLKDILSKGKISAILVEDFVFTARSTMLAKRMLEDLGVKIIAVLSFFNQFGEKWPFEVLVNTTLMNLDFTKYTKDDCPVCLEEAKK